MFYVLEISTGDSRIAGRAIYSHEDEIKAYAAFHQKLATAMNSDLYTSNLVMVLNDAGTVLKREKYVAPTPIVEPAAEEEQAAMLDEFDTEG